MRTALQKWLSSRARRRGAVAALSVLSLTAGLLGVGGVAPAAASAANASAAQQAAQLRMAPGTPGEPSAPILLFEEDFERRAAGSNVLVSDYAGADGTTYATDPFWGNRAMCNGFIVDFSSTRIVGDCNGPGGPESTGIGVFDSLAALPHALGQLAGSATPETNAAAASYTSGSGANNLVQFATESPLEFPAANRFVTFSVDAAATNCFSTDPLLRFYLRDASGAEIPVSDAAINPCLDPRASVFSAPHQSRDAMSEVLAGTFAADSSVLLTGESFGIVLRNENGNGAGNDGAYDNIRVLDVTPQLDKSFSPASTFVDGVSTLTFTVTNTSELAAKDGWGFTDTLPQGLEVATTPNLGGTCVADRAAEPGGTTISVTNGALATDEVSCTITVDVTSSQVGTYTNDADNVDEVGLNPPGEATVEFLDPADVTCVSDTSIFNTATDMNGGSLPAGSRDLNWQVGRGNASGFASVTSYEPAYVVPPVSNAWIESPYGNADWISYNANGSHAGNIDLYFRYDFTISELVQLDGFALPMDFYADNSVPEVWVNGVAQSASEESLPQSPTDPYFHGGFREGTQASTRLSEGFQHGENTIIVRVASGAPYAGFLAQILPEPVCADYGDAPDTYGTTAGADGARHGVAPGLTLGSEIDPEAEGQPSPLADGDDANGIADENALESAVALQPGATAVTVPVTVTNARGAAATLFGWIDVDGSGTFDADEAASAPVPDGATSVDLEFSGLAPAQDGTASYMRLRLTTDDLVDDAATAVDERALGVAADGEVEDHAVTVLHRELSVAKSTTFTADSRAGDTVEYTVTVTNTGDAAYTDAAPAIVFDDLSGVLDDATFGTGPRAVASDGSDVPGAVRVGTQHVSWAGPLAVGAAVEITYSVTLTGAGDGVVRNVAWQPSTPPPAGEVPPTPTCAVDGVDPETDEPCATTSGELPRLAVAKRSDVEDLPADGGVVTYEVTVTNPGPGDYTATTPASVRDDLSAVLDDATFNGIIAPASGVAFDADAQELTWSGPLAAGESVAIEYSVTYDERTGDNILYNVACVPAAQAAPGADDCASVRVPAAELAIEKSVDPADGSTVRAGQEVAYTLSFSSLGETPAAVASVDDLSDVLDDATFVEGSLVVSSTALSATLDGDALAITGEVPVDETITVSYRVRVDAFAEQADHVLANTVQNPDGSCDPEGCPGTENPIRHLSVDKSATPAEDVLPGDTVEYTVTVTNDGAAAYTAEQPAVLADDMTDVLDDARFGGDAVAVASDGSDVAAPAIEDGTLTWSGPLAVGASVTITYSVTVTNLGDHDLVNTAGGECAEGELCDPPVESRVLLPRVVPSKSADPASGETVVAGDVVTYTLSWTNDGQAAGPIDATDDLSDVLDDADLTAEPVVDAEFADAVAAVFDADAQTIRVTGSLLPGETVAVTYQVTVRADGERGDNIAGNVLTPDVPPYVPNPDCEGEDCPPEFPPPTTEHRIPQLEVAKSADPASGATVRAGQEITYALSFASIGEAAVTVDQVDDLSDVLDDAALDADSIVVSDAALTAALEGDQLRITGVIPADETVTVSYAVVVRAYAEQGDHVLGNVVTNADGSCQPGGCPETEHAVRHLSVTKAATPAEDVLPGDVVEYEVTVTNDGAGDYTTEQPAVVTDDMTEVLDDAAINGDVTAVASDGTDVAAPAIEDGTLTWSGPLATGQSVTITYSVTVTNLGDHDLVNTAGAVCAEGELCDPPAESSVLLPHVTPAKAAAPASGETVVAGDVVTYTLSWTNDGQAVGPVDATDDLSGVLDDAELTTGPVVGAEQADAIEATFDAEAETIRVTGDIAVGETVTVTYQVTVRPDGERGDNIAGNVLTPDVPPSVPNPDCEGEDCPPSFPPPTTQHRIPEIVDGKSATPESGADVEPGRELTYTLTFENLGEAVGTVDRVDDLTHVLDDADVTVAPTASDDALSVSEIADGRFSITGELAAGQTVTVTYTVTVKAAEELGDTVLSNFLLDPGAETPAVDACDGGEDCTRHTISNVVDAKSVDVESGTAVTSGQELTYTLTFENRGSAPGAVAKVDDLTHVLDDADVTVQPSASDDALTVSPIEGGRFAIEGELAPGQVVAVSYSVTVRADDELGDTQLANFLLAPESPTPESPADCVEGSEDCTRNAAPRIVDAKSVDPASSTAIRPGQELTYTLEFENTGAAAGAVHRVDDLTHVLDDADVTVLPAASDEALSVSQIADGRFSITGELAAGQSVTVTYTVTVHAADALGDAQLANFLLDPEQEVPEEPVCANGEDCTFNPVSDVTVAKAADPASGTAVEVGQELTYTLTFRNEGAGAESIDYTDHMAGVLDDAELTQAPTASDEALTVSAVTDGSFSVSGELAAGQTVTVTYAVTVRDWAHQGDHTLGNVLAVTGQAPPAVCEPESALCTEHEVEEPPVAPTPVLPETGQDLPAVALFSALGLLLLAAGAALVARRRRAVAE